MQPFFLKAKTISDAWFQLIYNIFDHSYTQEIQHGSFEKEQYRLQYPGIAVFIEHPAQDMVPQIPPALGIPSPTTMEYIEDYFVNYLMNPELANNETYTYASRIQHPMPKGGTQLERVIKMLGETPLTNQAVVEIATPEDLDVCFGGDGKLDPPCLRLLDFKAVPGGDKTLLTVSAYFRSWDLWAGFTAPGRTSTATRKTSPAYARCGRRLGSSPLSLANPPTPPTLPSRPSSRVRS
jgi:thymidylate synthase